MRRYTLCGAGAAVHARRRPSNAVCGRNVTLRREASRCTRSAVTKQRIAQVVLAFAIGLAVASACGSGNRRSSSMERSPAAPGTAGAAGSLTVVDGPSDAGAGGAAIVQPVASGGRAGSAGAATPGGSGPIAGAGGAPNALPVSQYCGDAIRDPVLEECDDGPGTADDSCTEDCRIRSIRAVGDAPEPTDAGPLPQHIRSLGSGRHPVATTEDSIAVVFRERAESTTRVMAQLFSSDGQRDGDPLEVSVGTTPSSSANPVVAELPDDRFAVLWADPSAGSLDIAVQVVGPSREIVAPPMIANETLPGPQQDPDALWTGSELMVAWTDEFDLKIRRFTGGPGPLEPEQILADSEAIEANVSLCRYQGTWAAAWRAGGTDGLETVHVRAGQTEWTLGPFLPGPAGDHPALVELDAERLLVVFTEGTAPESGPANVGRLRFALLDTDAPGDTSFLPVGVAVEPYASDDTLAQSRPALARAGEHLFLGWQTESPLGDTAGYELWLSELEWSVDEDGDGELVQNEEVPLPIDLDPSGNQQSPALAASPLSPGGALVGAWEDASGQEPGLPIPDVVLALRPVPLVTLVEMGGEGT